MDVSIFMCLLDSFTAIALKKLTVLTRHFVAKTMRAFVVLNSCKWCCRENISSICVPYIDDSGMQLNLPAGMPCIQGYCNDEASDSQLVLVTRARFDSCCYVMV